ncbi:hypothetical protein LOK49_LG02G01814 [Camellia lanceoleosa]|uniref:Uncharacterized protein n=1 Tax=Camellia lanceoleosa TaxID=1840588 RepID=A0ACC0ITK8_9ERIC|nr:hypothetical protein LOK49_LG02G01814 [Camellia lanceoleosa]
MFSLKQQSTPSISSRVLPPMATLSMRSNGHWVKVRLDESHYFFSLRTPKVDDSDSDSDSSDDKGSGKKGSVIDLDNLLNYGLTIASKWQEGLLKEFDEVLEHYSSFSVPKVSENGKKSKVLDVMVVKEIAPEDLESEKKKKLMEEQCAAY